MVTKRSLMEQNELALAEPVPDRLGQATQLSDDLSPPATSGATSIG